MGKALPRTKELRNFRLLAEELWFGPALAELSRRPELWGVFRKRQEFAGSAHKDTESIPLRGPSTLTNVLEELDSVNYPIFPQLQGIADLVHELGGLIGAREIGRVMLVKLKPQGKITPHRDEGSYARYFSRFHFPLQSRSGCEFLCGSESIHMSPGELWWFNHQIEHEVHNFSVEPRIHLIFDAVAPGFNGAICA